MKKENKELEIFVYQSTFAEFLKDLIVRNGFADHQSNFIRFIIS